MYLPCIEWVRGVEEQHCSMLCTSRLYELLDQDGLENYDPDVV